LPRARVLLAEDHVAVVERLRTVLESEFDVIGTVGDGRALVAEADRLLPDVVVTDITMPLMDGVSAATEILHRHPEARIVFVSVHNHPALIRDGLATGALGYVLKAVAGDELVPAVQAALRGERHVAA
jgi:DNA-binding NarL/FixJ family response regulator